MQFFHRWLLPITIKVCTTRVIFCSDFKRGIVKEPKCKNYYKKRLLPSLLFSLHILAKCRPSADFLSPFGCPRQLGVFTPDTMHSLYKKQMSKGGYLLFCFRQRVTFFLFQTESHFFCFRQRVTFMS